MGWGGVGRVRVEWVIAKNSNPTAGNNLQASYLKNPYANRVPKRQRVEIV